MAKEDVARFYQIATQNEVLQNKLGTATDQNSLINMAVSLGEEYGCRFSAAEFEDYIAELQSGDSEGNLSEAALETVAGGAARSLFSTSTIKFLCTQRCV